MNYSVNPMELTSFFAIPSSIADDHIKLASEYQLKALLLFLRYQNTEEVFSQISKKLSLNEKEVSECLDYWVQRGVLLNNEKQNIFVEKSSNKDNAINNLVKTSKPTREEAIKRIASCAELEFLVQTAETTLSRPITASEYRTFVWIYDQYGLPTGVIIQAMQYAVNKGKGNFAYIEKICVDWAKNDINTMAKAEEKLNLLYLVDGAWKIVSSAFGIPYRKASANEEKYADKWVNKFEFNKDMLICAYNICVDNTKKLNFKYIDTIFENWHKKGFKKPADVESDSKESQKELNEKNKPSYDVEKIKKKINNFD